MEKYTEEFLKEHPLVWIRTSFLMNNGSWHNDRNDSVNRTDVCTPEFATKKQHYYFAFQHVDSIKGDQSCVADVTIEQREWIDSTTADRKISNDLNISFPREIGPEAGTYKGGTIGFLFEINNGESYQQAFDRMERTYIF
jgi:hypothetical protein